LKQKTKRLLYLTFGWTMFTLGFVGTFLPVLPTTPFMILALWRFSNGSETIHDWLYNHPRFGPALQDWDQYRMIPVKAKITAVTMMTISATYLIFFSDISNFAIILAIGLMAYGAIYVLTKPSRYVEPQVPQEPQQEKEPKPATPPEAP
jgi:uncharacterized membrane protein YbaN (DUF454 family)